MKADGFVAAAGTVRQGLRRMLGSWGQTLATTQAMARAGAEINARIRAEGARDAVVADRSDLLWRTYEKYGLGGIGAARGAALAASGARIEARAESGANGGGPAARAPDVGTRTLRAVRPERGAAPIDTSVMDCLTIARAELGVAKARLAEEISHYPTPVARCDVQFNRLLVERKGIAAALQAIEFAR